MQLSRFQKSYNIKKRISSRTQHRNIELPYIYRTIDVTERGRINTQNNSNFLDKFFWALKQTDYKSLEDDQIYRQYQNLRQQIFKLNDFVVKELNRLQGKIQRKRLNTQVQSQKTNEVRQKEIGNNLNILQRMQKEYHGLKVKSQNLPPKESIQQKIESVKNQIASVKQKISSLKLKNKEIGDNIMNTDQVFIQLRDAQRENDACMKKKQLLETKLQKLKLENEKIYQNLNKILTNSSKADCFIKIKEQNNKHEQERKKREQIYREKIYSIQVLKKNCSTLISLKQQKYHQLLKQLQSHNEKDELIISKTYQVEQLQLSFSDQIEILQSRLKKLKEENSKLSFYDFSLVDKTSDRSINVEKSAISKNVNRLPKFNTFAKIKPQNVLKAIKSENSIEMPIEQPSNQALQLNIEEVEPEKHKISFIDSPHFLNETDQKLLKVNQRQNEFTKIIEQKMQQKDTNKQYSKEDNNPNKIKSKNLETFKKDQQNPNHKVIKGEMNKQKQLLFYNKSGEEKIKQTSHLSRLNRNNQKDQLTNNKQNYHLNQKTQVGFKQKEKLPKELQNSQVSKNKKQEGEEIVEKINQDILQIQEKRKYMEQPQIIERFSIDLGAIEKNIDKVSIERVKFKEEIFKKMSQNLTAPVLKKEKLNLNL